MAKTESCCACCFKGRGHRERHVPQLIPKMVQEELVVEIGYLAAVALLLSGPKPLQALALGIHQQRVFGRAGDDDAILDGVVVGWQAFDLPVGDL